MKRFVNGIMEDPIWQKRVPQKVPDWLQTATVAFPSGRTAEELVANDEAHLVWAVNLGVIDFNPWPARRGDLDHPDELRVDLDPTPGIAWDAVRQTAMVVRDVLAEHGLRGYPKTSGSKGIHVQRADRAALGIPRGPARGARAGARGRAARPGPGHLASGGRRSGTACSSTTTRTRATAPSRPATRCARRPTRGSRARSSGTRCPTSSPATCGSTPCLDRLAQGRRSVGEHRRRPGLAGRSCHELARRDEEGGLGDAPWPPHFPQAEGRAEARPAEPRSPTDRRTAGARATRSRAARHPACRLGGLQRGFGSKPRTGQGHEHEFDE